MDRYQKGTCRICEEKTDVRNKNIYPFGSEGLWVCISCEMRIVEFIRQLCREKTIAKITRIIQDSR